MPSVEVDARHFSPDTQAFVKLLDGHGVRYLIVGGQAAIFHGNVRLTGDVDFFFASDTVNATALFRTLVDFWDGEIPGVATPEELATEGLIIQFGLPPNRIDLLNAITGVTFEEAWNTRVDAVMIDAEGRTPIPYIGADALVKNKRAAGRPKDLEDLAYLEREA